MYCITKSNFLRRFTYKIIKHPSFEWVILGAIIANSLNMVVATYVNPDDPD